jgi:four helix bundle protein
VEELINKAFDFSIRVIELANYLDEEKRQFPLTSRLLECAEEICVCLRVSHHSPKSSPENSTQAYQLALEAECLLELMVKTGAINETQSKPILSDCRFLKDEIKKTFQKPSRNL